MMVRSVGAWRRIEEIAAAGISPHHPQTCRRGPQPTGLSDRRTRRAGGRRPAPLGRPRCSTEPVHAGPKPGRW